MKVDEGMRLKQGCVDVTGEAQQLNRAKHGFSSFHEILITLAPEKAVSAKS
ncbi:hypothetical protein [Azospirillum melinis]